MKKLYFVGYGGGHIKILDKICQELTAEPDISFKILALTSAYEQVKNSYGADTVKQISDYLPLFDADIEQILTCGQSLLAGNFTPGLGISKFESIAYLGLSYFDLVKRLGPDGAKERYSEMRRHAFLPTTVMEHILVEERPDVVIATTSPKCEQAALIAANMLGIATAQILDLFEDTYPPPEADHIITMNELVATGLREKGFGDRKIHPLGQPVFDETVSRTKELDARAIKNRLGINESVPVLLIASNTPLIVNKHLQVLKTLTHEDAFAPVFKSIDGIAREYGLKVLLRIHPNETAEHYRELLRENPDFSLINNKLNLYESLAVSDFVFVPNSTIAVEAMLCGKPTLTFQRDDEEIYPFPRAAKLPFIFSHGIRELEQNLLNVIERSSSTELKDFYIPGAAKRIAKFLVSL